MVFENSNNRAMETYLNLELYDMSLEGFLDMDMIKKDLNSFIQSIKEFFNTKIKEVIVWFNENISKLTKFKDRKLNVDRAFLKRGAQFVKDVEAQTKSVSDFTFIMNGFEDAPATESYSTDKTSILDRFKNKIKEISDDFRSDIINYNYSEKNTESTTVSDILVILTHYARMQQNVYNSCYKAITGLDSKTRAALNGNGSTNTAINAKHIFASIYSTLLVLVSSNSVFMIFMGRLIGHLIK